MSTRNERLRQRELLRSLPREMRLVGHAVEEWLRFAGGATGIVRCTPELIAVDVGTTRARVARVLQAIADIRPQGPDGPPLASYDADVHVWYWLGHIAANPPRPGRDATGRPGTRGPAPRGHPT